MIEVFSSGGPVMWLILCIGAGASVIFLRRFFELRRAHVDSADFMAGLENLIGKGGEREAIAVCEETPSPVARVVAAAIRRKDMGPEAVKEAADAAAAAELRRFARRLSVLDTATGISPVLGLFGTVVGFAKSVAAISGSPVAARTDLLSAMAPALACAAAGLLVAVVTRVMHDVLRAKISLLGNDLSAAAGDMRLRFGGAAA